MVELPSLVAVFYVGLLISVLIFFCVLGILWALKRSAVRKIGRSFIKRTAAQDNERASNFKEWLESSLGYAGGDVEAFTQQFLNQEAAFFQSVRLCVIRQDEPSFQRVIGQHGKLTQLFQQVEPQQADTAEEGPDPELIEKYESEANALKMEVEAAEEEKTRLREQLAEATDTMNSVIDEYSMMFSQKADQNELNQSKLKMLGILKHLTEKIEPVPEPV